MSLRITVQILSVRESPHSSPLMMRAHRQCVHGSPVTLMSTMASLRMSRHGQRSKS